MPQNQRQKDDDSSSAYSSDSYSFDPVVIEKAVYSLVLSKFGPQYNKACSRSSTRRLRKSVSSSSSDSLSEESLPTVPEVCLPTQDNQTNLETCSPTQESPTDSAICLPTEGSSNSAGTSDISDLLSYVPPQRIQGFNRSKEDNTIWPEGLDEYSDSYDTLPESKSSPDTRHDSFGEDCTPHEKITDLKVTKAQILKAIYYDDLRKKAILCVERLEAERLLLVTDIKSTLRHDQTQVPYEENEVDVVGSGNLEISNIRLWLNDIHNHYDQCFLFMVIHNTKVLTSEIAKVKSSGVIYFNKKFDLSCLRINDKLGLRLYSISRRIFKKSSKSKSSCMVCIDTPNEVLFPSRGSLFQLWGHTELAARTFTKLNNAQFNLNSGALTFSVATHADVKIYLTGFSDVILSSSRLPFWNKQWAVLNGKHLRFFNYPPFDVPNSTPTETINLTPTCSLHLAPRAQCARKLTLLLKINDGKSILMSFETQYECDSWRKYLQCSLLQIEAWEKP